MALHEAKDSTIKEVAMWLAMRKILGAAVALFVLSCTSTTPPPAESAASVKKSNAGSAAAGAAKAGDDKTADIENDKASDKTAEAQVDSEEKVAENLSEQEKKKLDEMTAEMELGRGMAGRLLQFYGMVDNEKLIKYLNTIGRYVGNYSDVPDRRYMFAILDSEQVNAFACPGGYILITLGAVRLATNEAEMAMILGHEVAHVGKQHMFNTLKSMSKEDMDKAAAEMEAKMNLPPEVKVRERIKADDSAFGNLLARYLSGGAGAGFSVLKAAKAGMSVILEKGLDQKLEYEADHEGVKYAIRAGYDPTGLSTFLGRILANTPLERRKVLNTTHPPIDQRLARISELLKQLEADKIVGAKGGKRFAKYAALLPPAKKK